MAFKLDVRLDVLLGAGAAARGCTGGGGGGGDARLLVVLFGGRPVLFFGGGTTGSTSGSDSAAVLTRFDPRVNRKSPSCSSYTDEPARRLLYRRSAWLLMLKTSKGCRVRTRVVMDGVSGGA